MSGWQATLVKAEPAVHRVPPITDLMHRFDVREAVAQLDAHPELWNQHTLRTERYDTPHSGVSDIWLRFNDWSHYAGDVHAFTMLPHESVWYPAATQLPALRQLALDVFRFVVGESLGGVLITKIPPGGEVAPHVDSGWHATHYEKFAVQLKGNREQAFHFDDAELRPLPGDLYTFDNARRHWVTNGSDEDRITLIVCVRR
jgi:hypothetical protein